MLEFGVGLRFSVSKELPPGGIPGKRKRGETRQIELLVEYEGRFGSAIRDQGDGRLMRKVGVIGLHGMDWFHPTGVRRASETRIPRQPNR